jgi:hypothetical protein
VSWPVGVMLIDLKTGDVVGVEALTPFVAEPGRHT